MKFVKPNQLDQSNPGTWPIYYQVLVWLAILGLVWFIYDRFFYKELLARQESNQTEITQLQGKYRTLYQFSMDLPLYEARKIELTDKLLALLQFLPAETEMPNLIDETYKAAYNSGINFTQFTPEKSITEQYYNIEPISLSTSTVFDSFTQFVQYIGELPRILNVKQFNMDISNRDNDLLDITSELETYIYNQDITKFLNDNGDTK